jgi:hypothetical protein
MTIFSFSLAFGSSCCASCAMDSKFKLCFFCCQCTHQGGDWKIKLLVPWFDCDKSFTCRGLNSNLGYFGCFTPICSCEESCLLVSWCVGDRCDIAGNNEDLDRNRRPDAEDRGWSSIGRVLGGRTIGRSGDACVVCTVHKETRSTGFLV